MSDTLFDTFDPFDLDDGVPLDLLTGIEPRDLEASYLRVHDGLLDDDAIGDLIADCGAAGLGMWLAVLVAAKEARAFGVLSLNAMTFGGALGATPAEVLDVVQAMTRAGLVWSKVDGRRVMLRVRRWHRWQSLTDAEVKRLDRRRTKHGVAAPNRRRRNESAAGDDVPPPSLHEDEDGHEDVNEERPSSPPSRAPAHVREGAASGDWSLAYEPLAVALRRVYDDEPAVVAALNALRFEQGMRKALFSLDGVTHGVNEVADRMEREPGWTPDKLVPLVMSIAKTYRPGAAPVPKPDPKRGTTDDRPDTGPKLKRDPALARFR